MTEIAAAYLTVLDAPGGELVDSPPQRANR